MPESPNINWNDIRPLNGSQAKGFEEMCTQLAGRERPNESRLERKGTPDAGVECYASLNDGSEWGWQAKYWSALGTSQWNQLDDSVKTALEKHPRLVRYFVGAPMDRPDARNSGQQSSMQRWETHRQKWAEWAAARGMNVEFIWWGNHELVERLTQPKSLGLRQYWFRATVFGEAWFQAHLEESIKAAGPRYTPEIHVDLPIAQELEAFGRTEKFFNDVKSPARNIRKRLRELTHAFKLSDTTLDGPVSELKTHVGQILVELGAIAVEPIDCLPLKRIVNSIGRVESLTERIEKALLDKEREYRTKPAEEADESHLPPDDDGLYVAYRNFRHSLYSLTTALQSASKALDHADDIAGSSLALLKGGAGTGKTHLLCDVAKQRLKAGRPTVLLMGQRFLSSDNPWTQALQQLDLNGLSAEEFVGALEAAAQVAGCRGLVLIDALNEGSGRLIWPPHLAAFLEPLEKSPWIAVLLAVRSSYEEVLVPNEVRDRAVSMTHNGFGDREYDATRTFFSHYGLELPSTPLLAPEFRNPLFLKTLCIGLQAHGETRLPRGFHGISRIFSFYLSAVNGQLASALDFNPRAPLVKEALQAMAGRLAGSPQRWMSQSDAELLINTFLPGRDFSRSLYQGLVGYGVLLEETVPDPRMGHQQIALIAYDRFADHVIAKVMLDAHLNADAPASCFNTGAPLAFIRNGSQYVSWGLIEALSIQIPERTGRELVALAPELETGLQFREAFRQSVIWRSPNAISDETEMLLRSFSDERYDLHQTLDVLLTVATLPEHRLNAHFLDELLRRLSMADRDAGWSTFLHNTFENREAVDRLVDWASGLDPSAVLENDTVDLCSTALAWMLTTSNRPLRDRATKALVTLLTGRLDALLRFVKKFADVDDLYVLERVYAVAYGVAMRTEDVVGLGNIAQWIYSEAFEGGSPVPHILLRDYARGVIERALVLKADIDVVLKKMRPPYVSSWPHIPTKEEIDPYVYKHSLRKESAAEHSSSFYRISGSVMNGDFGWYVIGTNSSTNWLSVRLDSPKWKSGSELEKELVSELTESERAAWKEFDAARSEIARVPLTELLASLVSLSEAPEAGSVTVDQTLNEESESRRLAAVQASKAAQQRLESMLTKEQVRRLKSILEQKHNRQGDPPRFDLQLIQRYILRRVFDLGWTDERFGQFDQSVNGSFGRETSKAERIGKKYQWIAYHEILAFVADHFQYYEDFRNDIETQRYDGPWQENLRDIDPSCTLRSTPEKAGSRPHSQPWWDSAHYDSWGEPNDSQGWAIDNRDVPQPDRLLRVLRPNDGSEWLNLQGYFQWQHESPADEDPFEVERRELWFICSGYLIPKSGEQAFMEWAKSVDFWGRWMPEAHESYRMFLGEYGWSPAFRYFRESQSEDEDWTQPGRECPIKMVPVAFKYIKEGNGFDCSVDDGYQLRLPTEGLTVGLHLHWTGRGADFVDAAGQLAAFDPTVYAEGPSALLLRRGLLEDFLAREGLAVCWTVLGEKRAIGAGFDPHDYAALQFSGAYVLRDGEPVGFVNSKAIGRVRESQSEASNG